MLLEAFEVVGHAADQGVADDGSGDRDGIAVKLVKTFSIE